MTHNNSSVFTSVLDEIFNTNFSEIVGAQHIVKRPAVNIINEDDKYLIEVAAPGLSKKDFKVDMEHDKLIISTDITRDEKDQYTKQEYNYDTFSRSFRLSKDVDKSSIKATYKNGILSISMGKLSQEEVNAKTTIAVG